MYNGHLIGMHGAVEFTLERSRMITYLDVLIGLRYILGTDHDIYNTKGLVIIQILQSY